MPSFAAREKRHVDHSLGCRAQKLYRIHGIAINGMLRTPYQAFVTCQADKSIDCPRLLWIR